MGLGFRATALRHPKMLQTETPLPPPAYNDSSPAIPESINQVSESIKVPEAIKEAASQPITLGVEG